MTERKSPVKPAVQAKPVKKPKDGYHHGDLRRALLDAALTLVANGGLAALSLRESARLAGVSTAAPYHHFKNREELVVALAIEGFEGMQQSMLHEVAEAGAKASALDRLDAVGRGYVRFAISHRAHFLVMFAVQTQVPHIAYPALGEAAVPVGKLLFESVEAVHARLKNTDLTVNDLARIAWAVAHGISWLILDDALFPQLSGPPDELAARTITTLCKLVAH